MAFSFTQTSITARIAGRSELWTRESIWRWRAKFL